MCGRFSLNTSADELLSFFKLRLPPQLEEGVDLQEEGLLPPLPPRYNVSPSQDVPVIRAAHDDEWPRPAVETMHWGFIPSWAKGSFAEARKQSYRMINARAESAASKPSWKRPLQRRRCLVPTTGFYEWDRSLPTPRPALLFHPRRGHLLAMAGLWDRWEGPDGVVGSFSILTCEAVGAVAAIHDRMPVFVDPDAFALWLDPDQQDLAVVGELLRPPADDLLVATDVGTAINDSRKEGPDLLGPAPPV
ncbi:MAG: SOS response-associated peptidase [Alphaproteobacteria bacterium]|nr:SOS response-associated peptidase [Alphaproteobacteria bacterium]